MQYWNFGVYADRAHTTICYVASVRAETEHDALRLLRIDLKPVPMALYIGAFKEQQALFPDGRQDGGGQSEGPEVVIVKL